MINKNFKTKTIIAGLIIGILFIACSILSIITFATINLNDQTPKLVGYYKNNDNYQLCRATITEIINKKYYKFDSLLSLDDKEIPSKHPKYLRIFSDDIDNTIALLNPVEGKTIEFKTCFANDDTISFLPVVQITDSGSEILEYNAGKEALVLWAQSYV